MIIREKVFVPVEKEVEAEHLTAEIYLLPGTRGFDEKTPGLDGDRWKIFIDLRKGVIRNWSHDETVELHIKPSMLSNYHLAAIDTERLDRSVLLKQSKAPSNLLPYLGQEGRSIFLIVNERGKIKNWNKSASIKDFYPLTENN